MTPTAGRGAAFPLAATHSQQRSQAHLTSCLRARRCPFIVDPGLPFFLFVVRARTMYDRGSARGRRRGRSVLGSVSIDRTMDRMYGGIGVYNTGTSKSE